MPSNPTKGSSCTGYLALGVAGVVGLTACNLGVTDSTSLHSRVVLDVRSIVGAQLAGDFLSVVDSAHLTIASSGNALTLTRLLGPGASEATFNITVQPGSVRFTLDVISNNGMAVYRADTTITIDGDFALDLTARAVNPVMVVYPAHAAYTLVESESFRTYSTTLRVRNSGLDSLHWRVDSLVPRPQGVSYFCSVLPSQDDNCLNELAWSAGSDAAILVTFTMPDTVLFQPPQSLTFISQVGSFTTTP